LDIAPLQQMTQKVIESDVHLFNLQPAILYHLDIRKNKGVRGDRWFSAKNPCAEVSDLLTVRYVLGENGALAPPGAAIYYYLKKKSPNPVEIKIFDRRDGQLIRRLEGAAEKGVNRVIWDLRKSSTFLSPTEGGNDAARLRESGLSERPGFLVEPGEFRVVLVTAGKHLEHPLRVESDEYLKF
jgi:hypothetical protein